MLKQIGIVLKKRIFVSAILQKEAEKIIEYGDYDEEKNFRLRITTYLLSDLHEEDNFEQRLGKAHST